MKSMFQINTIGAVNNIFTKTKFNDGNLTDYGFDIEKVK